MGQVSNVGCHKHTLLQVGISVWIGYPVVASKFMHWTNSFLPWTSNVLLDCNMVFCRPATWGCCFFSSCCVGCICACHWASLVTQEYSCLECWALFHPLLSRTSCQELGCWWGDSSSHERLLSPSPFWVELSYQSRWSIACTHSQKKRAVMQQLSHSIQSC